MRPPVGRCPVPGTVSGRTCFLGVRPAASSAAAPSEPRGRSSGCPCSPRWLGSHPRGPVPGTCCVSRGCIFCRIALFCGLNQDLCPLLPPDSWISPAVDLEGWCGELSPTFPLSLVCRQHPRASWFPCPPPRLGVGWAALPLMACGAFISASSRSVQNFRLLVSHTALKECLFLLGEKLFCGNLCITVELQTIFIYLRSCLIVYGVSLCNFFLFNIVYVI